MLGNLAAAVRERRVAARELVGMALDRIERHDGELGAVVLVRADEALAEAAELDDRLARGEGAGPLVGIPFLVKDIEDLRGAPTTHGSLLFRDAPPAARDGVVPGLLRAAGAIAVGKANTPEFASEGFTANRIFGITRNPWAPAWSPGGSSGGSGAAIAAGIVPVATATDTGGSIRIPAAFCGLVGLKPTNGLVPRDPALCWPELTTCGPLAAATEDLRLLLDVMAGRTVGSAGRLPRRVVAVPRFAPWGPLPAEVAHAFERALDAVEEDLGLPVERMDPEDVIPSGNVDLDWGVWAAPELVEWLGRDRAEAALGLMHPAARRFVEFGLRTTRDEYEGVRARASGYARDLDEVLGGDAVIASPTLAVAGWLADGRMPGSDEPGPPFDVYNCDVQNMTGMPAISVPAGRLQNGVPFGLQLTGPRFGDAMLLDLAAAWERARPWPRGADGYEPFDV